VSGSSGSRDPVLWELSVERVKSMHTYTRYELYLPINAFRVNILQWKLKMVTIQLLCI